LEGRRLGQHLGDYLRHVVVGQVLRPEYRDILLPAPRAVEQQCCGDDREIARGHHGDLAAGGDRGEELALGLDGLDLVEKVVHERGHRQGAVAHARAGDQVFHRERGRHMSGVRVPWCPAAEGRDDDDPLDALGLECLARRSGEVDVSGGDAVGVGVRRCQPEHGVSARERLGDDVVVAV
jgi:hypothetical protein